MFHNYVKLPEGKPPNHPLVWPSRLGEFVFMTVQFGGTSPDIKDWVQPVEANLMIGKLGASCGIQWYTVILKSLILQ
jgi:hypothetical protein